MVGGYAGSERRGSERVKDVLISKYSGPDSNNILVVLGGQEFHTALLDLSEGGMAITSKYLVPSGSVPLLKFVLLTRPVTVKGRIVNKDVIKAGGYRLGIQFEEMNPPDMTLVTNFCKSVVNRQKAQTLQ